MRSLTFCGRLGRLMSVVLVVGGCGGPAPETPSSGDPGVSVAAPAEEFASRIGTYMPPLEGGRLEIAAPEGWSWVRPGSGYLVGFTPGKASLNDLPRILISTDVPPYPGIEHVDASNIEELVQQVDLTVGGDPLESAPRAIRLGESYWVEYVSLRRSRDVLVNQLVLETVAHGRWYAIRLEVSQGRFGVHRPDALAVGASCRFSSESELQSGQVDLLADED